MKKKLKRLFIFIMLVAVVVFGVRLFVNDNSHESEEIVVVDEEVVEEEILDQEETDLSEETDDFEYCYAEKVESQINPDDPNAFSYDFIRFARRDGVVEGDLYYFPYATDSSRGSLSGDYSGPATLPIETTLNYYWSAEGDTGVREQLFKFLEESVSVGYEYDGGGEIIWTEIPLINCTEYRKMIQEYSFVSHDLDLGEETQTALFVESIAPGWSVQAREFKYKYENTSHKILFEIATEENAYLIEEVKRSGSGFSETDIFEFVSVEEYSDDIILVKTSIETVANGFKDNNYYIFLGGDIPVWHSEESLHESTPEELEHFFNTTILSETNNSHYPQGHSFSHSYKMSSGEYFVVFDDGSSQGFVVLEKGSGDDYGTVYGGEETGLVHYVYGYNLGDGFVVRKKYEDDLGDTLRNSFILNQGGDYVMQFSIGVFDGIEYFYNEETMKAEVDTWSKTFVSETGKNYSHPEDWIVSFDEAKGFVTVVPPVYLTDPETNFVALGMQTTDFPNYWSLSDCVGDVEISTCAVGGNDQVRLVTKKMTYFH